MRDNKIRQLTDKQHVKMRPQMYVGATEAEEFKNRWVIDEDTGKYVQRDIKTIPALVKLFDEIISNSIDEAFRTNFKYANKIIVDFGAESGTISVGDNGRGIPLRQAEGQKKGITEADLAISELRAGGNFDDDDDEVSMGTHGLGATLVNLFSEQFSLYTADGKECLSVEYTDGMNRLVSRSLTPASRSNRGTRIAWHYDRKMFPEAEAIWQTGIVPLLEKRVNDLACIFPQIEFSVAGKGVVKGQKFANYIKQYGDVSCIFESEQLSLAVLPSEYAQAASFVNGIDTYSGGTHVEYVRDLVVDRLIKRLGRQAKKLDVKPSDVKNNLAFVFIVHRFKKPKFNNQLKDSITSKEADVIAAVGEIPDSFIKRLSRDENITIPILEYKKLKNEHRENVDAKKAQRGLKKLKVVEHVPANGPPEKCYLYLTEGKSASGKLTDMRDPMIHGSFPLRGKPLNTYGAKISDILQNKEISELLSILGLRFGDGPDTQLAYGHIRIMADADQDGQSIVTLLIGLFAHWPWLFDQKRISIVRCPIVIFTLEDGKLVRCYTFAQYQAFLTSGVKYKLQTYFKGLGSLNDKEYHSMVHNPVEDLIAPMKEADKAALELALGESADARKVWLCPSIVSAQIGVQ